MNSPVTNTDGKPSKASKVTRRMLWLLPAAVLVAALWFGGGPFCRSQAQRALQRRDLATADWWARSAHRWDANHHDQVMLEARVARRRGDSDAFRLALSRADQLGVSSQRLDREQTLMLAQLGQLRGLQSKLSEMLINPGDDGVEICEAFVTGYFLNYRLEDASIMLDTWSGEFPNDPQPYLFRGKIKAFLHEYKGAAADLRQALQLNPKLCEAHYQLGCVLTEQSQLNEALPHLRHAMADQTWRQMAQVKMAICFTRKSQYEPAIATLSEVLKDSPSHAEALLERGKLLLLDGKPEQALDDLKKLVELRPRSIEAHFQLSIALSQTGHQQEAEPHLAFTKEGEAAMQIAERLTESVASKADDADARYEAGTIFLKYGQDEKGLHWLRSVLNYQPQEVRTLTALADWYRQKAKEDPAYAAAAHSYEQLLMDAQKSGSTR